MSLYGSFSRHNHLDELDEPLLTQGEGVISSTTRKARCLANLGVAADANSTATRTVQVSVAGRAKLGGSGAGWVIDADNALPLATLPASQTSEVLLLPLDVVPVGATVTGVSISGQVESAGNNVTLALDVRKITAAAADFTDASIATDNVGTLTADTIISSANLAVTGLSEVIAEGEWLYCTLTGTTAASTDIAIAGAIISYTMPAQS